MDENVFWFKSSTIYIDKIEDSLKEEIFSLGKTPIF